jgi:MoaA/NifB/PqqE/SkfB family radical SAM enzyme
MPELVEWAVSMGVSCVILQPMDRWTPETYNELWIEEPDLPEFEQVIERLIEMQRRGAPILTSPKILRLFPDNFREKKAPPEVMPCRVGMRDFFIRTDGKVQVCVHYPPIGNIREQSARDIWYGPKAQEIRRRTVGCDRLCLITCHSQKTLLDKVKMGAKLLKGQDRRTPAAETAFAE